MDGPSPGTLRALLHPFRRQFLIAAAALASVHLVESLIPLCLKGGIDRIVQDDHRLALPVAGIFALTALRYVVLTFGRRKNALISVEIRFGLRRSLYAHLIEQGPLFFSRFPLGDLMARATNDIDAVWIFFRSSAHRIIAAAALLVIAPIFMALQSVFLTVLVLSMLVALTSLSWFVADLIRRQSEKVHSGFGDLIERARQSLQGIRTVQAHAQEEREYRHFAIGSDDYKLSSYRLSHLNGLLNSLVVAGGATITLVIAGVGATQVQAGAMTVGALTAFISYLSMFMWIVRQSAVPARHFLRAVVGARRISEILEMPPELSDAAASNPLDTVRGGLALRHVSFNFPDGRQALRELNLVIEPGEFVAILGRIGSGKSTLLRLLCRQLDPNTGTIALDGHALRSIPLRDLRRIVALVSQESFLFAAPIGENISYDDPERSPGLIWDAAEVASLASTIRAFPDELRTWVGERGLTLSGGQRQRTSLARGVIRDAPILLLDDCFSALDAETEFEILQNLRRRRAGRTTLFVTHRLSMARHADRVLLLEKGRLEDARASATDEVVP